MEDDIIVSQQLVGPSSSGNLRVIGDDCDQIPSEYLESDGKTYTITTELVFVKCVTLPDNSVLNFTGEGSIKYDGIGGVIYGSNSTIIADHKVFENITLRGTWNCVGDIRWFADGCKYSDIEYIENNFNDAANKLQEYSETSSQIQNALNSTFSELVFPPCIYYIKDTLVLNSAKKLTFKGNEMMETLLDSFLGNTLTKYNTPILFTDKDKPILKIKMADKNTKQSVTIEGGNFDVSICGMYTSSCIKVIAANGGKIWGLTINGAHVKSRDMTYRKTTNGNKDWFNSIGIDINPNEEAESSSERGHVTNVRINSKVSHLGTGVKVLDIDSEVLSWCTDVVIDGDILYCARAVYSNAQGTDIKASIQSARLFRGDDSESGYANDRLWKDVALIELGKTPTINGGFEYSISSPIFDIRQYGAVDIYDGSAMVSRAIRYSNYYALKADVQGEDTGVNKYINPYGQFLVALCNTKQIDGNNPVSTPQPTVDTLLKNSYTVLLNLS